MMFAVRIFIIFSLNFGDKGKDTCATTDRNLRYPCLQLGKTG